ncbi:hypothetical protein TELCIR_14732, partial [Teladorsagia circumcincta]
VPKRFEKYCSRITSKARRIYCGMLTSMDFAIGRVIDFLKASKKYDNTVIIFTSDVGDGINQWNYIITGIPKLRRFQFVYNIDEHGSAIRDGDFKLILGNPDRRIQEDHGKARLYRITEDPGESNDLSKVHPGIVHRLKNKILELQKYMRKNVRKPLSLKGSPERCFNLDPWLRKGARNGAVNCSQYHKKAHPKAVRK